MSGRYEVDGSGNTSRREFLQKSTTAVIAGAAVAGLNSGADDYVTKPFSPRE